MMLSPYHMEWRDWADSFALFQDEESESQKAPDEEHWQEWAMSFVGEPDGLGQNAPDPYMFDDWREWAARLMQTAEFN